MILSGAFVLSFAGCGNSEPAATVPSSSETSEVPATEASEVSVTDNSNDIFVSAYPAFEVTSQSLHDGVWDEVTAYDDKNASPELSWEPVEGASTYVIYMIDMDPAYIIH